MKPEPAPIATPERVAELNAEALRLFRANVQRIQSENGPDGPETLREIAAYNIYRVAERRCHVLGRDLRARFEPGLRVREIALRDTEELLTLFFETPDQTITPDGFTGIGFSSDFSWMETE